MQQPYYGQQYSYGQQQVPNPQVNQVSYGWGGPGGSYGGGYQDQGAMMNISPQRPSPSSYQHFTGWAPSFDKGPEWGPSSRDERGTWGVDRNGRAHWNSFRSVTGYDCWGRSEQGRYGSPHGGASPGYGGDYGPQRPVSNFCTLSIDNDGANLHIYVMEVSIDNPNERKPDPYVECSVGREHEKTGKRRNTNYAMFNEQLRPLPNRANEALRVRVMDSDVGRDDLMFEGTINLFNLPRGQSTHTVSGLPR